MKTIHKLLTPSKLSVNTNGKKSQHCDFNMQANLGTTWLSYGA